MEKFKDFLIELGTTAGTKILFAILILAVGIRLFKFFIKWLGRRKGFQKIDPSVQTFIKSTLTVVSYILLFISAAVVLGVPISSFITMLASAGVAIGLALQGSLSNFAGGLMILLFKPFKVGDYIEVGVNAGTVKAITVFYTILVTPDNKHITLPNGTLTNTAIANSSAEKNRRIVLAFSLPAGTDRQAVREGLEAAARETKGICADPAPVTVVEKIAPAAVDISLIAWCGADDYERARFALLEKANALFEERQKEKSEG